MRSIKTIASLLSAFCFPLLLCAQYWEEVDAYQDFNTAAIGTNLLTTTVMGNSKLGGGTWEFSTSSGVDTTFQSFNTVQITPLNFPHAVRCGGQTFTNTGTNAIHYNMDTALATERVQFVPPNATYTYSNLLVSGFLYLGANYFSGAQKNFDHIHAVGGSFCVMQQQLSSQNGTNVVMGHSESAPATSFNGPAAAIQANRWYYFRLLRDNTQAYCRVRLYDATNFAPVLVSDVASYGNFGAFNVWFQAHYAGQVPGSTLFAGISVSYVDPRVDIGSPWRIIPDTRLPVATVTHGGPGVYGESFGVRGGIAAWQAVRTSLTYLTNYGVTTNFGTVLGSMTLGQNTLTVDSVGDFATNQYIYVPGAISSAQITNISGTTLTLASTGALATVSSVTCRHDSATPIQARITAAASNEVLVLPQGNIRAQGGMVGKSFITIRSDGTNSVLVPLGASSFTVGPTPLQASQGKQFTPTNAWLTLRGATNCFIITNRYWVGAVDFGAITAGETYEISQLNDTSTNARTMSVYGFPRVVSQTILIESVTSNRVTFSPALQRDFTNSPLLLGKSTAPVRAFGLERVTISLTNPSSGEFTSGTFTDNLLAQNCIDSWFIQGGFTYARNYNLHMKDSLFCEVSSNLFKASLTSGTSHSGFIMEGDVGLYVANNRFEDFRAGIQQWGLSTMNNWFFANYFSNCIASILHHNTHHMLNVYEANVAVANADQSAIAYFQSDGYTGSNSDETLFRNFFNGTMSVKRFSPRFNFVGNRLGTTAYTFRYDDDTTGGNAVIFELGYPNIANLGTNGASPPLAWNYPQTFFHGNQGEAPYVNRDYTNVFKTFTNVTLEVLNSTNLQGNFTNWPYSIGGYVLVASNATGYRFGGLAIAPPTETNMLMSSAFTVPLANGETLMISGPDTYQQRQTIDNASHLRHGNTVVTNLLAVAVWDSTIADRVLPDSLTHPSVPAWWGTNVWPAMSDGVRTFIPAEFWAQSSSGSSPPAITIRSGGSVRSGGNTRQ